MEAGFVTGSGHWQVMLTVASPTWKLDRHSVPLTPGESLTSPEYHSRLFTARLCVPAHPLRALVRQALETCGLAEAGFDCQSVKISVLCEPCSWLCTPRGQPVHTGCVGSRDAPLESQGIISDGFSPPHQSRGPIVCQPSCGWRGNAVCSAGLFCLV